MTELESLLDFAELTGARVERLEDLNRDLSETIEGLSERLCHCRDPTRVPSSQGSGTSDSPYVLDGEEDGNSEHGSYLTAPMESESRALLVPVSPISIVPPLVEGDSQVRVLGSKCY